MADRAVRARVPVLAPPPDEPAREVLTADQVAEMLALSRRAVLRLPIPCVRLGPRTVRYLRADVMHFLEKRRFSDA